MEQKTVKFNADGIKERDVVNVSYDFHQQTDVEGQPSGLVRGGTITLTVKSLESGATDILEWMVDPFMSKNGSISFPKRGSGAEMKKLEFENGYCVQYNETYHELDNSSQYETFTISAKKVKVGIAELNNKWTDHS